MDTIWARCYYCPYYIHTDDDGGLFLYKTKGHNPVNCDYWSGTIGVRLCFSYLLCDTKRMDVPWTRDIQRAG